MLPTSPVDRRLPEDATVLTSPCPRLRFKGFPAFSRLSISDEVSKVSLSPNMITASGSPCSPTLFMSNTLAMVELTQAAYLFGPFR